MIGRDHERYCQELANLIARCDPDLPDEQDVEAIERHIEHCPACQRAEAFLTMTANQLRVQGTAEITRSFEERLVERLCAQPPHTH